MQSALPLLPTSSPGVALSITLLQFGKLQLFRLSRLKSALSNTLERCPMKEKMQRSLQTNRQILIVFHHLFFPEYILTFFPLIMVLRFTTSLICPLQLIEILQLNFS